MDETQVAPHRVHIEPSGLAFRTDGLVPLLRAAQGEGIRLPSSCRNGTCRACMCRLIEGRITYRIEWPGLSAEEKAEGWILPCVAHACTDLTLDAPNAEPIER